MSAKDIETETIRWPTNLDRAAIEQRLDKVAQRANELGLTELAAKFASVTAMPPAQIASSVVNSLNWLFNQPAHDSPKYEDIARDLQMVALNLKNLK